MHHLLATKFAKFHLNLQKKTIVTVTFVK